MNLPNSIVRASALSIDNLWHGYSVDAGGPLPFCGGGVSWTMPLALAGILPVDLFGIHDEEEGVHASEHACVEARSKR